MTGERLSPPQNGDSLLPQFEPRSVKECREKAGLLTHVSPKTLADALGIRVIDLAEITYYHPEIIGLMSERTYRNDLLFYRRMRAGYGSLWLRKEFPITREALARETSTSLAKMYRHMSPEFATLFDIKQEKRDPKTYKGAGPRKNR